MKHLSGIREASGNVAISPNNMDVNQNSRPFTVSLSAYRADGGHVAKGKPRGRPPKHQPEVSQQCKGAGKAGKVVKENLESRKLSAYKPLDAKAFRSSKVESVTNRHKKKSHNWYRALKRKCRLLEEERSVLAEELEKTETEVDEMEKEKSTLLDKLLVWEGLYVNPYPPFQPHAQNNLMIDSG